MSVEDCIRAKKESVDFSSQGISLQCPFGSAIHFHNWLMIESSGVLPVQCFSINNVFPVTSWCLSCLFYFQRSVGWRTGRCYSKNSKVAVVTVEPSGVESPQHLSLLDVLEAPCLLVGCLISPVLLRVMVKSFQQRSRNVTVSLLNILCVSVSPKAVLLCIGVQITFLYPRDEPPYKESLTMWSLRSINDSDVEIRTRVTSPQSLKARVGRTCPLSACRLKRSPDLKHDTPNQIMCLINARLVSF